MNNTLQNQIYIPPVIQEYKINKDHRVDLSYSSPEERRDTEKLVMVPFRIILYRYIIITGRYIT